MSGILHHDPVSPAYVEYIARFCGGGLGAVGRYLVGLAVVRQFGAGFPYGTLMVNVIGSLLMGALIGWLASRSGGSNNEIKLFFATGVLGGFTTFSAFSLDMAKLWEDGLLTSAFIYAFGTLLLCLIAVFVGLWLSRQMAA